MMTLQDVCLIVAMGCFTLVCISYSVKLLNESFTKTKLMKLEAERSASTAVDSVESFPPIDQAHGLTNDLRKLRNARFSRIMNPAPDMWGSYTETTTIPSRHNKKGRPQ